MSNDWMSPRHEDEDEDAWSAPRVRASGPPRERPAQKDEYRWDDDVDDDGDPGEEDEAFDREALTRLTPQTRMRIAAKASSIAAVVVGVVVLSVFDALKPEPREQEFVSAETRELDALYEAEGERALAAVEAPFEHPTIGIDELLVAGGDRKRAILEDAVRRAVPQIEACYANARRDAPQLAGTVQFLVLHDDAKPTVVPMPRRNTLGHPELAICASKALSQMQLARSSADVRNGGRSSIELSFRPPPDAAAATAPDDPSGRPGRD